MAEIVSLGVAGGAEDSGRLLVSLFNHAYLVARCIGGATDFVITVNPRHMRFYERTLLFAEAGPERDYGKVGGAPAVLLRLDLDIPEERVRLERDPAEARPPRQRTMYHLFRVAADEPALVAGLASALRPMSPREIDYFFVRRTDILARATPEQRAALRQSSLEPAIALAG